MIAPVVYRSHELRNLIVFVFDSPLRGYPRENDPNLISLFIASHRLAADSFYAGKMHLHLKSLKNNPFEVSPH